MPVVLLKSASKHLHEGFKSARRHLGGGGGGGKSGSFSDRDVSRLSSFDSATSEVHSDSRHAASDLRTPIQEGSKEIEDSNAHDNACPETPKSTGSFRIRQLSSGIFRGFGTPTSSKAERVSTTVSTGRIRFSKKNKSNGRIDVNGDDSSDRPRSCRTIRNHDDFFNLSAGEEIDRSHSRRSVRLSPRVSSESDGFAHKLTGFFNSSLTSLKRTAGSQEESDSSGDGSSSGQEFYDLPVLPEKDNAEDPCER
jgi:hypothetical protein